MPAGTENRRYKVPRAGAQRRRLWRNLARAARASWRRDPGKNDNPLELRRGLPGSAGDIEARYLEARVGDITYASIYLPNGNPRPGPRFDYKLAWFNRLVRYTKKLCNGAQPVVLAGDFNVVPTDADIYNPWWWREDAVIQPETRAAYQRLLAQGWTDTLRNLNPAKRIYTFWTTAQAFARNAGFRMDFLLVNPVLFPRVAGAGVDAEHRGRDRPSDHAPVWLELRNAAPRSMRMKTGAAPRRAVPSR